MALGDLRLVQQKDNQGKANINSFTINEHKFQSQMRGLKNDEKDSVHYGSLLF